MRLLRAIFRRIHKFKRTLTRRDYREIVLVFAGVCMIAIFIFGFTGFNTSGRNKVYAVQSNNKQTGSKEDEPENELQAGLMGIVASVNTMEEYTVAASSVNIENAGEDIIIGTKAVKRNVINRNAVTSSTKKESGVGYFAQLTVRNNQMASEEYYTLLQIVEAEASGEDIISKIMVANVVLNRVEDYRFPDSIYEVVWQKVAGAPQFSPTADGRIYSVTISDETIEAVDRALSGEDHSQGALFFVARASADQSNVAWFDGNLVQMFEYGGHEFFGISE